MAVEPNVYEGIEGIDSEGFLEPGADEFEVGAQVGKLLVGTLESEFADTVTAFLTEHGLPEDELTDPLIELIKKGIVIQASVRKRIPLPKPRPIEAPLTMNDLATDAADVIPVNPAHGHFMQQAEGKLLDELEETGVITPEIRKAAHLPVFRALVAAADLGYRARVIETME